MRYAKLGRTGRAVSRPGPGCTSSGDPPRRDRGPVEIAGANAAPGNRPCVQPLQGARARPGVTAPIVGAAKLEHPVAAVAALAPERNEEERAELAAPCRAHPVLGRR